MEHEHRSLMLESVWEMEMNGNNGEVTWNMTPQASSRRLLGQQHATSPLEGGNHLTYQPFTVTFNTLMHLLPITDIGSRQGGLG